MSEVDVLSDTNMDRLVAFNLSQCLILFLFQNHGKWKPLTAYYVIASLFVYSATATSKQSLHRNAECCQFGKRD